MTPAIEVSHLTKEYRLGAMTSLREGLRGLGARLRGRERQVNTPFKALDDVSFTVQPGEVVGVIGHNGAGKSTLLKMISRITTPTRGSVTVNGRIAPLIEVGAGFVGDFTGRENVYLNGAILGLKRKEIDRKFDEIVAFAEMEEFIDTPVKRYSSGMQVKLAFAVATSIESEILIVDEVLAVGDLAFQRKCFDRMEQLIKREKRTVLLVSHNIRQVERICTRVIQLDRGRVAHEGDPLDVCNRFFEYSDKSIYDRIRGDRAGSKFLKTSGSGELQLSAVEALDKHGRVVEQLRHNEPFGIRVTLEAVSDLSDVAIGIGIHTPDLLFVTNDDSSLAQAEQISFKRGRNVIEFRVAAMPLLPGTYSVRIGIAPNDTDRTVLYGENLASFAVTTDSLSYSRTVNQGFFALNGSWSVQSVEVQQNTDLHVKA